MKKKFYIDTNIGEKIKFFRLRAGLSQFALETKLSTGYGSICRIENGMTNPTKETIIGIAKVLKLNQKETAFIFGIILGKQSKLSYKK